MVHIIIWILAASCAWLFESVEKIEDSMNNIQRIFFLLYRYAHYAAYNVDMVSPSRRHPPGDAPYKKVPIAAIRIRFSESYSMSHMQ